MVKLQQIKRSNGSLVYSLNIPLDEIERMGWEKGDELIVESEQMEEKAFRLVVFRGEETAKMKKGGK